jgi:hypothetical protein
MSLPADILHAKSHPIWDSRRLWSLADMIDFILHNFVVSLDVLRGELNRTSEKMRVEPHQKVPAEDHTRIQSVVKMVAEFCVENLALPEASSTLIEIYNVVGNHHMQPYSWQKIHGLLETINRQIRLQIQGECFFHYKREYARFLVEAEKEWAPIFSAFPSIKSEVTAGLDCYAIGHNTACVFYMMRVAEFGLRIIARERGIRSVRGNKPIEYAMWGEVIGEVQKAIDDLRVAKGNKSPLTTKKRKNREIATAFYSGIIGDMQALLALYRDRTMHFRASYDKGEAYSAMRRVYEMMTAIASKLSETDQRRIRWGL